MTTDDWPQNWSDEPWPLDDPVPAPSLTPRNWSDTHIDPPQVADLADEAWQRAVDRGISMEQALVELQDQRASDAELRADQTVWHDAADLLRRMNPGGRTFTWTIDTKYGETPSITNGIQVGGFEDEDDPA